MLIKALALKNAYLSDENGATAVEYGLLAAGIAALIAIFVFALGDDLVALFESDVLGQAAEN